MEELSVHARSGSDWALLRVSGDIDINAAPYIRQRVVSEIEAGRPKVGLDLSDVTFMDSSGLAAIVGALKRARQEGGSVVLIRPAEQVRRILTMTDLVKVLPIVETDEQALTVLQSRSEELRELEL